MFSRFMAIPGDASVDHRIEVWEGGLKLISASPFNGWGRGMSGNAYVQWMQPLNAATIHYGMVNSYLHLGVERGLPSLFLVLILLIASTLTFFNNGAHSISAASGSCLVGFAVSSIFTTLWIVPSVIWIPLVLIVIAAIVALRTQSWLLNLKLAFISFLGGGVILLSCWVCGGVLQARSPYRVQRLSDGGVSLTLAAQHASRCTMLCDYQVLGSFYGREVRKALLKSKASMHELIIYPPFAVPDKYESNVLIILGARIETVPVTVATLRKVIVCPTGPVREDIITGSPAVLFLPSLDAFGFRHLWEEYAKRAKNVHVQYLNTGYDIRSETEAIFAGLDHY
jgi:hypothetical protein